MSVGKERKGTKLTVRNVSIQGVGWRATVLLSKEIQGFDSKFMFIASSLVQDLLLPIFTIATPAVEVSTVVFKEIDSKLWIMS